MPHQQETGPRTQIDAREVHEVAQRVQGVPQDQAEVRRGQAELQAMQSEGDRVQLRSAAAVGSGWKASEWSWKRCECGSAHDESAEEEENEWFWSQGSEENGGETCR